MRHPGSAQLKFFIYLLVSLLLVAAALLAWLWPRYDYLPARESLWKLERHAGNPIVADVAEELGYVNINGPSVIRVPDWIENPLGKTASVHTRF